MPLPSRLASGALAAVLLALAACGDEATGPRSEVVVSAVAAAEGPPSSRRLPDLTPAVQCVIRIRAQATGSGEGEWTGATLRWFLGTGEGTPFDSVLVSGEELRGAWLEGSAIVAGEERTARFSMEATIPFRAEIALRYRGRRDGPERETTAPFHCGWPAAPDAAPLAVAVLDAQGPAGRPLELGDTLTVSFTATSGAVLWHSRLTIDGPCGATHEAFEPQVTSATHVYRLPITRECAMGVPFGVQVDLIDGAGRIASRRVTTDVRVVDATPPAFQTAWFSVDDGPSQQDPWGLHLPGDSLAYGYVASDARGLSWLVWELLPSGARDSVPVAPERTGRLPLTAAIATTTGVRLFVRDSSGLESAPVTWSLRDLRILPVATDVSVRTATLPVRVRELVVDPKRDVAYLTTWDAPRIDVLSLASLAVVRSIATPAEGMALSAGGDSLLFTTAARTLGILDLRGAASQPSTFTLDMIGAGARAGAVHPMANGRALVTVGDGDVVRLLDVDLATGGMRWRTDAPAELTWLARSGDGATLLIGSGLLIRADTGHLWRYSAATGAITSLPSPHEANGPVTMDVTGSRVVFGSALYDGAFAFQRRIQVPTGPTLGRTGSRLSPDGETLYYTTARGLVRARTSDGALLDFVRLPVPATQLLPIPGSSRVVGWYEHSLQSTTIMVVD